MRAYAGAHPVPWVGIGEDKALEKRPRTLRSTSSDFLLVSGQLMLLTFSIFLIGIWLAAFLSPSKAVTIAVNSANEALPELFLLSATLPLLISSALFAVNLIVNANAHRGRPTSSGRRLAFPSPATGDKDHDRHGDRERDDNG